MRPRLRSSEDRRTGKRGRNQYPPIGTGVLLIYYRRRGITVAHGRTFVMRVSVPDIWDVPWDCPGFVLRYREMRLYDVVGMVHELQLHRR